MPTVECLPLHYDEHRKAPDVVSVLPWTARPWRTADSSKVNTLAKDVTENLDRYELGIASRRFMTSFKNFRDWYIEMVPRPYNKDDANKAAAVWTLKISTDQRVKTSPSLAPLSRRKFFCNLPGGRADHHGVPVALPDDQLQVRGERHRVSSWRRCAPSAACVPDMNVPAQQAGQGVRGHEDSSCWESSSTAEAFSPPPGYANEVVLQKDKEGEMPRTPCPR